MTNIHTCSECASSLPHSPRPVFSAHPDARLVIIGQAPGRKVHENGMPFNDPSGDLLREWLQVDRDTFYAPRQISIIPMGFCYPGKGKSGDLPPRKECAPLWHPLLFSRLKNVRLTLLVGMYAQQYYLRKEKKKTLTETVRNFQDYLPGFFPLPHPSPRNRYWLTSNPWFDRDVVPALRQKVRAVLSG